MTKKRNYPKNRAQSIYVITYGKRPIAAFKSEVKAKESMEMMLRLLPKVNYSLAPKITKIPVQG